ncbi:unnamed protein product [Orchesella dallaii]|uniref:poly(ADP-ribose) glycohydrolase n=1 Tax=Orchesella dallaii TaxID=48710 RepID=A0ABP1RU72_9HEXA
MWGSSNSQPIEARQLIDPMIGGVPAPPKGHPKSQLGSIVRQPAALNVGTILAAKPTRPTPMPVGIIRPHKQTQSTTHYSAPPVVQHSTYVNQSHTQSTKFVTPHVPQTYADFGKTHAQTTAQYSTHRIVQPPTNINQSQTQWTKLITPSVAQISADLEKIARRNPQTVVFFHKLNANIISSGKCEHDAKWHIPSHVSTPFSSKNLAWGALSGRKWDTIKDSLEKLSRNCAANPHQKGIAGLIKTAISQYDTNVSSKTDFGTINHPEISSILTPTIPIIVNYALMLPSLLAEPIPFLRKNSSMTIYLTKNLVCSLMANAFFCTLEEKPGMDDINFYRLFNTTTKGSAKVEKLKCIITYFQKMRVRAARQKSGDEIISFERRCITAKQNWTQSISQLVPVNIEQNKTIEKAVDSLKVDFANKQVGGGVLNEGAVMEEIMFATSPELIISRLFTEPLEDNEVLIITGTEQFSNYIGYSQSFRFAGPSAPSIKFQKDKLGRIMNPIVVMDALNFKTHEKDMQYQQQLIDRELHKAFVGFMISNGEKNIPIATGNWGGGVFNGDPELKFLIQWMAASQAGRLFIVYHTIGYASQAQSICSMADFLRGRNASVGQLYKLVTAYVLRKYEHQTVFDFVKRLLK